MSASLTPLMMSFMVVSDPPRVLSRYAMSELRR